MVTFTKHYLDAPFVSALKRN